MPKATTRVYLVELNGKQYLVDQVSANQSRLAIAKRVMTVRLAKPSEIVKAMRDGSAEYIQYEETPATEPTPPADPPPSA